MYVILGHKLAITKSVLMTSFDTSQVEKKQVTDVQYMVNEGKKEGSHV